MIAANYIRTPAVLRFQREMRFTGQKGSPLLLQRLMGVIFRWLPVAPKWAKAVKATAARWVKAARAAQLELF